MDINFINEGGIFYVGCRKGVEISWMHSVCLLKTSKRCGDTIASILASIQESR